MLFSALYHNQFTYLLPVSLDVESDEDLDSYTINKDDKVKIQILEPINPMNYYMDFISCYDKDKNDVMHELTDKGMKQIADSLGRKYSNSYIELYPKGNVMFSDGTTVKTDIAQDIKYKDRYNFELHSLSLKLLG